MFDVWIMKQAGDDWEHVCSCPNTVDMGEIVAALQVLFGNFAGIEISPEKTDAIAQ